MEEPIDTTPGEGKRTSRTTGDIRRALENFTVDDWRPMKQMAKHFATINVDGKMTADDLLQEALTRALSGDRRCPHDLDIGKFLRGTMRSLVSAERETDRSGGQPMLVGYLGEGGLNPSSEAPDPEHRALSSIYDTRLLAAIMAAINDDPMLVALASAVCDGIEGEALQQLLGVSASALATSRRKLKRRIDATRNRDLGAKNGR